ncbi:MAG TPA: hypothetical protein VFT59_04720 [Candidatus Saccharimonadales bacterium]|nr:hypothetical protein [Candidatus Saccharimonadales bacterium]
MNLAKRSDYIHANRGKIEAIKAATTQIVDMMNPFVLVKEDGLIPAETVQDQPTPEQIYTHYLNRGVELTSNEALRLAARRKKILRRQAEIAILGLHASTTMLYLHEHQEEDDDSMSLVRYARATYATADALSAHNDDVQLSYTQLEGLESGNSTASHEITINNGTLTQALAITSLDNAARNIKYNVWAAESDFLNRCLAVLTKEHVMTLTSLLSKPVTVAEVDAVLGAVWEAYKHNRSQRVAPLLNEARSRALHAQQVRDKNDHADTSIPSIATLSEFGRLVGIK